MPIRLRCPSCNAGLSVASRKAGQTIRCPGCGAEVAVPHAIAEELPVSAAPAVPPMPPFVGFPHEDDDGEEELSIRKPATDVEEMDLTPMVDMTFLLLIFFMITASFTIQKVMSYPPPEPEQEGVSQVVQKLEDVEKDSIIVEVDENDQVTVENQPVPDRSQLENVIAQFMNSKQTNELLLKQHYYSSHEMTVVIKDAAAAAGIQKFRAGILPGTAPRS